MNATSTLRSYLCLIALTFSLFTLPSVAQAAPANDNFANATVISGASGSISGTNVGATRESGESISQDYYNSTALSVWYRWTAPADGGYTFSTTNATYDSIIEIGSGASVSTCYFQWQFRDQTADKKNFSVTFRAIGGATYHIRVFDYDTNSGPQGNFTVKWASGPINDEFPNAITISGVSGSVTGTNVNASRDPIGGAFSDDFPTYSQGKSVWYRWTAPTTGGYTFRTTGSYPAYVNVATGVDVDHLVGKNQRRGPAGPANVTIYAVSGTVYHVLVGGSYSGSEGTFELTWTASGPPNDHFSHAAAIAGKSGSVSGTYVDASREPGEPSNDGSDSVNSIISSSVWYRWTAPESGRYTFQTSSGFPPAIAVTTGASLSSLSFQALVKTPIPPNYYSATFSAVAGTTYSILIYDDTPSFVMSGRQGPFVLSWNPAPINDDFANATPIGGDSGSISGTTVGSSKENGELIPTGQSYGRSVWYRWTAPASAGYTFRTNGAFNNVVDVETGSALGGLSQTPQIRYGSPTPNSLATFIATKGSVYYILVDDFHLLQGTFVLSWARGQYNDNLADAIELTGRSIDVKGANGGATHEAGEPYGLREGVSSVWYRWTAPATGSVAFTVKGINFNPDIIVCTGGAANSLVKVSPTGIFYGDYGTMTLKMTFGAVAGTSYAIGVSTGYREFGGEFNLYGGLPAANDNFAGAQLIGSGNGNIRGINLPATAEAGEPQHAGVAGGSSVWYKWTAPLIDGNIAFQTAGSDFNTLLGVYTGADVAHLIQVASDDDLAANVTGVSRVSFHPTAGVTYYIAVDGKAGATGHVALNWTSTLSPTSHMLWTQPNNALSLWEAAWGGTGAPSRFIYASPSGAPSTAIADGPDGLTRVLWSAPGGGVTLWNQDSASGAYTVNTIAPYPGYQAFAVAAGPDNANHVLWKASDGAISLWSVNPIDGGRTRFNYHPSAGWTALGIAVGTDNRTRILFRDTASALRLWSQESVTGTVLEYTYTAPAGWTPQSIAVDHANLTHVLWIHTDGRLMLWTINTANNTHTQFTYGPYAGWTATSLGMRSDGVTNVLLSNPSGQAWLWSQNSTTGALTQLVYGPYAPWAATGLAN